MKETAIRLKDGSVRAILAGDLCSFWDPVPEKHIHHSVVGYPYPGIYRAKLGIVDPPFPHGDPGDRIWVKECWTKFVGHHAQDGAKYSYRADTCSDGERFRQDYIKAGYPYQWRSSTQMPREAARIILEITGTRFTQDRTGTWFSVTSFRRVE